MTQEAFLAESVTSRAPWPMMDVRARGRLCVTTIFTHISAQSCETNLTQLRFQRRD